MNKNISEAVNSIFTKSERFKQEYCAEIVRVGELLPIEGADRLARTVIGGYDIVVGKNEIHEGDVVIYCKNETQLTHEFLSKNNLYSMSARELNSNFEDVEKALAEDPEGAKRMVGFFEKNGRVKMIRLRKCPSMGFIFGKDALVRYNPELADINLEDYLTKEDGVEIPLDFDEINGVRFIKAYVPKILNTPSQHAAGEGRRNKKLKGFSRIIPETFSFHYDTNPLNDNMWKIKPDDKVCISVKEHGCVERSTIVNTMEFGDLTIGEIVDKKLDCHIKAFDTETEENVYVPIDNFYMIPNDGEWYEIELEDGRTITITGNNPVWLPDLKCYRRVDELIGDENLLVD